MIRLLLILPVLLLAAPASAAPRVEVLPAVIDMKGAARDILPLSLTLTNLSDRMLTLYPVVRNLSASGAEEFRDPSRADWTGSLANWIEFSRGQIELRPGESRAVEFEIRVNLRAEPGVYHATIAFPEGSNRDAAEGNPEPAASALVNLDIPELVRENVQITRFAPARRAFGGASVEFEYEMENRGNRPESPAGEIIIYDRTGREIGTTPVNPDGRTIEPGASLRLSSLWRGQGLGQYKAILSAAYGAEDAARLQDTVFFWFLPLPKLVLGGLTLFFLAFGGSLWLHRKYADRHASAAGSPRADNSRFTPVVDLRAPRAPRR